MRRYGIFKSEDIFATSKGITIRVARESMKYKESIEAKRTKENRFLSKTERWLPAIKDMDCEWECKDPEPAQETSMDEGYRESIYNVYNSPILSKLKN